MNILKEYIRQIVRQVIVEQMPPPPPPLPAGGGAPIGDSNNPSINPYPASDKPPRLPRIRPAIGIGGVPKESGKVNSDRVKFGEAALQLLQSYIDTMNSNRRFDPKTARNLNSIANQIMERLAHDTNNWSDVEEDIEERLSELKPGNSALQKLIDYTDWYDSSPPDNATIQQYFAAITSDALPKINDALKAYVENYS